MNANTQVVVVSIKDQTLGLWSEKSQSYMRKYRASTAKNGPGEIENSGCTPRGHLRIADKIGDGWPLGTFFIGRSPVNPNNIVDKSRLSITTRILRLAGQQKGFNAGRGCDTFKRYIYIHGVPFPAPIPVHHSEGCIGLSNEDIADLYEHVVIGTPVTVYEQSLPEDYVAVHETTIEQLRRFFPHVAPNASWFLGATTANGQIAAYMAIKNDEIIETVANSDDILSQLHEMLNYVKKTRKKREFVDN